MIMLKKTHENIVSTMTSEFEKKFKGLTKVKDNEINFLKIENENLSTKLDIAEKEKDKLQKLVNLKDSEIQQFKNKILDLQHKIGGLTTQANKSTEWKKELTKTKHLLDVAEKEITEFVKPTKVETRYSTLKVEKNKLVDSERKQKRAKLEKTAKKINEKRALDKREQYKKELETPIKIEKVNDNEYVVSVENNG